MKALWPDTFVEEVNLASKISLLRKALGDRGPGWSYIQTVEGWATASFPQSRGFGVPAPARRVRYGLRLRRRSARSVSSRFRFKS